MASASAYAMSSSMYGAASLHSPGATTTTTAAGGFSSTTAPRRSFTARGQHGGGGAQKKVSGDSFFSSWRSSGGGRSKCRVLHPVGTLGWVDLILVCSTRFHNSARAVAHVYWVVLRLVGRDFLENIP